MKIISKKTGNEMKIGDRLVATATILSVNTRADTVTFGIAIGENTKFQATIIVEDSPFNFEKD